MNLSDGGDDEDRAEDLAHLEAHLRNAEDVSPPGASSGEAEVGGRVDFDFEARLSVGDPIGETCSGASNQASVARSSEEATETSSSASEADEAPVPSRRCLRAWASEQDATLEVGVEARESWQRIFKSQGQKLPERSLMAVRMRSSALREHGVVQY
jgi:hypothetical protein